jgi:osmotically inducible protein OsmC
MPDASQWYFLRLWPELDIPPKIETEAAVHLEKLEAGFTIIRIDFKIEADIPYMAERKFLEIANGTRANCPISRALAVPETDLEAK